MAELRSARASFMQEFDDELLPHTLEFANTISRLDVDVIMFTARKAACLFDAMRSVGLTSTRAAVVSDRVLDMDLAWLKGKSVALVDDVLVTGSSLFKARRRLLDEANVASVITVVLAVDTDWWVEDLVKPDLPHLSLPDRRAMNLCSQIVDALTVVPRPYNLDWPIYDGVHLNTAHLRAFSSMSRWAMTDLTTSDQRGSGVRSFTHDLLSRSIDDLQSDLLVPLDEARLIKVRIYSRQDGARTRLRILPILAFGDMPRASVDEFFDRLMDGTDAGFRRQFTTVQSRLRLVQFAVSARLGRAWARDLSRVAPVTPDLQFARKQLSFAFPPHLEATLVRVAQRDVDLRDIRWGEGVRNVGLLPSPLSPESQAAMTEPFLEMYRDREIRARKILLEHGSAAFERKDLLEVLNRLESGIPLNVLEDLARESVQEEADPRLVVSSFLDVAVDHGVAVPVIEAHGDYVRRVYRHGEDVLFSRNDERLFGIMLAAAQNARGVGPLPRLETEKLCVLMLRLGYRKGILRRWTGGGLTANRTVVGVRYDLQGAVVKRRASVDDSLFQYTTARSAAELLAGADVLQVMPDGKYSVSADLLHVPTKGDAETFAELLGDMLGSLLNPMNPSGIDSHDLTLLATCEEPQNVAAALAAEIDVFIRQWPAASRYLDVLVRGDSSPALREAWGLLNGAVSSGAWKFRKHQEGRVANILDRVEAGLDRYRDQVAWRNYWANTPQIDTPVPALILRSGAWLTTALAYARVVEIAARSAGRRRPLAASVFEEALTRLDLERLSLKNRGDRGPVEEAAVMVKQIRDDPSRSAAVLRIVKSRLEALVDPGATLLDRAHACIDKFGVARTIVTYSGALLVDLRGAGGNEPAWLRDVIDPAIKSSIERDYHVKPVAVGRSSQVLAVITRNRRRGGVQALAAQIAEAAPVNSGVRLAVIPELAEVDQVHAEGEGADWYGNGFLRVANAAAARLEKAPPHSILSLGAVETLDAIDATFDASSTLTMSNRTEAKALHTYEVRAQQWTKKAGHGVSTADIGILTILTPEQTAVCDWLATGSDYREDVADDDRRFYVAELTLGGERYSIVSTQAVDPGPRSMANAYEVLRDHSAPKVTILLGIAGSINPSAPLRDVVLGTMFIDYDAAADTPDGLKRSSIPYPVPVRVKNNLNALFVKLGEPAKLRAADGEFRLHRGPIGTGSDVIKYKDSAIRAELLTFNRKVLAVETEAAAVAGAYYELAELKKLGLYLVVRGISDGADEEKNDDDHDVASRNAVAALSLIIEKIGHVLTDRGRA